MTMRKNGNRWFNMIAIMFLISVVLSACGSQETSGNATEKKNTEQEKISLKIADIISNPVFQVAQDKGIFEKYGFETEIVTFATPAEGINALFINQVDIAWGADFPVLNAVSKGDYSIVASTNSENMDKNAVMWKLFVRDGIQKPEDLKGKTVSDIRGTFISYLWDEYLKENQLKIDDVKLVGQGGFDESYVALKNNELQAVWVTGGAMIEKFASIDGVHELTDMSKTNVRIGSGVIAPNSLLKENPKAVENFLSAIEETSKYITENPEETADIMFKARKQPNEITIKDLDFVNWKIEFSQKAYDSLTKQKEYMVDNGIIKDDFDLDSKLSLDAVKQVVPDRVTYEK